MTTPAVLMQRGVSNESQEVEMTTVRLTPNATSNFQTRFTIPKQGHVLDSNSALVWTISWEGYNTNANAASNNSELVLLKNFSGGLNTIQRARFYIGGREIFSCEDVGHLIHIKNLSRNPDYKEEIQDMEIGSVNGYFDTDNGKVQLGVDAPSSTAGTVSSSSGIKTSYNRYARALGSYSDVPTDNKGIECTVLLSDIFSALQSLQLPMALEEMRLEIDWNTDWGECVYVAQEVTATPIIASRQVIAIKEPVLLLDYLTFPQEANAGLGQVLMSGIALPYIHTSVSSKVIPKNETATSQTTDIQLALQSKLLMKMWVSHRLSNASNATPDVNLAPQIGNGRCRSQRGLNMSYNLYINDLAIHDQPVDTDSMQYSFFSIAHQALASVIPGQIAYNANADGAGANDTDVNSAVYVPCGVTLPTGIGGNSSISGPTVRDMVTGCQSYIGFDLSKYSQGSGSRGGTVVPSDAGFRSGSSAVILRITQTGSATADSPPARPKVVQVFTEEVKVLQVRGGIADTLDA
jgi:hypothetical protein